LVKSGEWSEKSVLLYPESAREMLMVQTWIVDCEPNREEIYRRLGRFIQHCRKLGLPNPYSMAEIIKADERWKKLHKNAVPGVIEIRNDIADSQERMNVKNIYRLQKLEQEEDDFDF
ncbi:MAG: hypothetical protein GY757_14305, partial [bacterium]|nr:hypothetical protein [bacterium]